MLTKANRLTDPADFKDVMRRSRRNVRPGVVVYTQKRDGISKFGVIAPNKVFASAVKRNRAKRVVREWFAQELKKHPEGIHVVVRLTESEFTLR